MVNYGTGIWMKKCFSSTHHPSCMKPWWVLVFHSGPFFQVHYTKVDDTLLFGCFRSFVVAIFSIDKEFTLSPSSIIPDSLFLTLNWKGQPDGQTLVRSFWSKSKQPFLVPPSLEGSFFFFPLFPYYTLAKYQWNKPTLLIVDTSLPSFLPSLLLACFCSGY